MISASAKLPLIVATRDYPVEIVRLVPKSYVIPAGVFECFVEVGHYDELDSEPDNFVAEPIRYIEACFKSGGKHHKLFWTVYTRTLMCARAASGWGTRRMAYVIASIKHCSTLLLL